MKSFRERWPDITIGTDVAVVGFPGENEIDFENTLGLISEKPDIVNCSRYSARTGTPASVLEGRLASEVAKDRSTRLHQAPAKVSHREKQAVGWLEKRW